MKFALIRFSATLAVLGLLAAGTASAATRTFHPVPGGFGLPGQVQSPHLSSWGGPLKKTPTCPSSYITCVTVGPGSSSYAELGWCVSYSGNCSSSLLSDVEWYSFSVTSKGKNNKKITTILESSSGSGYGSSGVYGNPIYQYIIDNGAKVTKGKKAYTKNTVELYYCLPNSSSSQSCYGPYLIGVAVD